MPEWIVKLARRILGLKRGYRYQLILTLSEDGQDWTVICLGTVETSQERGNATKTLCGACESQARPGDVLGKVGPPPNPNAGQSLLPHGAPLPACNHCQSVDRHSSRGWQRAQGACSLQPHLKVGDIPSLRCFHEPPEFLFVAGT
jgi:hypothetical protein